MKYIVGQIFGIIASVLCAVTPLFKKKWQMLVDNAVTNVLMVLNFAMIGETGSPAFLCVVGTAQSLVTLAHTLKDTKIKKWEYVLFVALYLGFGFFGYFTAPTFIWAFTWKNMLELLPIIGAMLNMAFVFVHEVQRSRECLLAAAVVWATYMAIVGSTGVFAEAALIITTVVSMVHYHKNSSAKN